MDKSKEELWEILAEQYKYINMCINKETEIAALKLEIKKLTELLDAYKEICRINNWPVPLVKEK